uniref:Uncharacterized protein n=1 Tax=Chrysotila carterae TaxID=13221 RepID=A0A7S4EZ16_CHRCT|mmetsp:Transcript_7162/g.15823  ORF Transcript_7162/g.15823 Transcript_7162/m.15823 type:complete len:207 (+) Transcript_7162:303-923(+)|eukprot:3832515-Pleurochrysis_carterae.AAC.4
MTSNGSGPLFKSSVTSRRFPALRTLTDDDVEVMVVKQPGSGTSPARSKNGSTSSGLFDQELLKSSKVGELSSPNKGTAVRGSSPSASAKPAPSKSKPRPPFVPCNPSQARDAITLEKEGYVAIHSPHYLAHSQQLQELEQSSRMRVGGTFVPASSAKAKDLLAVNYYMNSPDAETLEAEKRFIKERGERNLEEYKRQAHAKRSPSR